MKLDENISCSTSSPNTEKMNLLIQHCAQNVAKRSFTLLSVLDVQWLSCQKASQESSVILNNLNENWINTLQFPYVLSRQLLSNTEISPTFISAIGNFS